MLPLPKVNRIEAEGYYWVIPTKTKNGPPDILHLPSDLALVYKHDEVRGPIPTPAEAERRFEE